MHVFLRSPSVLVALAAALLLGGCTRLNAAFGDSDTDTDTGGGDGTATTRASASNSNSGPTTQGTASDSAADTEPDSSSDSSKDDTTSDSGTTHDSESSTTGTTESETEGTRVDCDPFISPCDAYAQDCEAGETCRPWGSDAFDNTGCFDIDDDPALLGEPCEIECSPHSGIDDCEKATMCDPFAAAPECVALCGGSDDDAFCSIPDTSCVRDQLFGLCRPRCNPLGRACGDGHSCLRVDDGFACIPGDPGPGMVGDQCEPGPGPNGCGLGLACINGVGLPDCPDGGSCCGVLCSVATDDCDGDLECEALFGAGTPPGLEDLGVCVLA